MKPVLIILNGDRAGERLSLEDARRYVMGRDQAVDICLPEKKISRRHATIYWEQSHQRVMIEDLGSLNGTLINGDQINSAHALSDGDRIQIGSYVLQIQISEASMPSLVSMPSLDPAETDRKLKKSNRQTEHEERADEVPTNTGGRIISGKLEEISLADLLQMLSTTKKTGRLILSDSRLVQPVSGQNVGSDLAILYLNSGDIEHAIFNGLMGEDAFYECLRRKGGYFALFALDPDDEYSQSISMPTEALLLEGFRRLDEEKANQTKLNPQDIFEVQPSEPLSSLTPNELSIFQNIWKNKKLAAVLDNSNFTEADTLEIVRKLLRSGFIKKIKK